MKTWCYSIIIAVFVVMLVLSQNRKKDQFTYSPAPVDYDSFESSVNVNPDLFLQKARISKNELAICKTVNGQYKCQIKKVPCS